MMFTMSNNGIDLLKELEGEKLNAYLCPAGILTIGIGHTGEDVYEGKTITPEQSIQLLRSDIKYTENIVNKYIKANINQNQFDALVSFAFNVGVGAFISSTLLKKINSNKPIDEIESEFMKWVYIKGNKSNGLINRRKKEVELYKRV